MQFVKNGPDVPDKLLQAHEEGKVVFFCGAGISFPAGLPSFGGLVWSLYEKMGIIPDLVQEQALKLGQFDTAISLLEAVKQTNQWRRDVRIAMAKLLNPDYTSSKSTSTHKALLHLSKIVDKETKESKTRLITTNFDRVFHKAGEAENLKFKTYQAPLLPVPKNQWDGLVYLHGLLPEKVNGAELDHLVISSGDFGLAYLTERWAARFVSELFRSYTVCFVGYSLNDPVLRYMMDALAADRLLGESPPEMFAFGEFKKGEFDAEYQQWKAKNVTPILYKSYRKHYYLHETISTWADTYRDGLGGKEQIVITTAFSNPSNSDLHNNFSRKLAWALSDPTGVPAKVFSQLKPSPPLAWLNILDTIELKKDDLSRFRIEHTGFNNELSFSLFSRPAKSADAPFMALSAHPHVETKWDKVMLNLGKWLTSHLNNPDLVLFVLKRGGRLHNQLRWFINRELEEQRKHISESNNAYFDKLKEKGSDAIVSKDMMLVWELVLAGYSEQSGFDVNLYSWINKYKYSSLTPALKNELKKILSPKVYFKKTYSTTLSKSYEGIKQLLDWDIRLSSTFVHSALKDLDKVESWKSDIAELLPDFNSLLMETMELKSMLNEVDEFHDYTYISQPSIKPHPQNKDYDDWTALIELLRDSWLSLLASDQDSAKNIIFLWWKTPFPLFKRLALFAMAEKDLIATEQVNSWLEQNDSRWLWSITVQRELMQLLPTLVNRLSNHEKIRLLKNIIKGPNRKLFRASLNDEDFSRLTQREIWLRLEKLRISGLKFKDDIEEVYQEISKNNPLWQLEEDQKEEFPFWMGGEENYRNVVTSPENEQELIKWLKEKPDHDRWDEDDWPMRCKNDFILAKNALITLEQDGVWIAERWREALQVWTENKLLSFKTWRYLSEFLLNLEDYKLADISWNLSRWLKSNSKSLSKEQYFRYFDRLIALTSKIELDEINDTLTTAINHPVGMLTESLFQQWYIENPVDDSGLTIEFESRFEQIIFSEEKASKLGKVIIAVNTLSLFRVAPEWTAELVLPWFSWSNNEQAIMAWRSYLWSPRLHKALLVTIKDDLLDTANHYLKLNDGKEQYARFLTYLALQKYDEYRVTELANAFKSLPEEALRSVASSLNDALSSSGDKFDEYWNHRVKVFLMKTWPKQTLLTEQTVNQIALLCLNTKNYFSDAFEILKHSLRQIKDTEYLVRKTSDSKLIKSDPYDVLAFLNQLIEDEPRFQLPTKLSECLTKIAEAAPGIESDERFIRLNTVVRQFE
ncbi:anti-phage defense-associated sirtuin Dsr1 [Psychromonas sp. PT13]|uniref:anti-phage defense-associated sirtuin Dsr1 n=1 Tax=Psychromonas sp. PT13 TaxID=3439547 RepID=UPI003EB7EAAE